MPEIWLPFALCHPDGLSSPCSLSYLSFHSISVSYICPFPYFFFTCASIYPFLLPIYSSSSFSLTHHLSKNPKPLTFVDFIETFLCTSQVMCPLIAPFSFLGHFRCVPDRSSCCVQKKKNFTKKRTAKTLLQSLSQLRLG